MEHQSNDLPHRKHTGKVLPMPLMGEAPAYGGLDKFIPSSILPDREEAGIPNIVSAITLGAVLETLSRNGMDNIRLKEIKLIDLVWEKLSAIEGVNLYGPAPSGVPRTSTIPFNIQGFDHGLTAATLNGYHNIQVRNGRSCAHPYVREILKPELWALDIDPDAPNSKADVERKRGMVRASLGIYTTESDILALAEAVAVLIARKDEILSLYEPQGSNGYRHTKFAPDNNDLFCPLRSLELALNSGFD